MVSKAISKTAQLRAIARYEFLMQWRQYWVLTASVVIMLVSLFMVSQLRETVLMPSMADESHEAKVGLSTTLLASFQTMLHMFSILLMPIIVADIIPKDRQYKVRELLDVYPLPSDVYLIGKILGAWLNLVLCLTMTALVVGVSWWFAVYPFHVGDYLGLWLVGVLPIALVNTALCILIASGQPSRRRAVMIGVVFAVACTFVLGAGLGRTVGASDVWNPARPLIFKYYLLNFANRGTARPVFDAVQPEQVAFTIAAAVIELIVVGGIVYWWMSRQETR